MRQTIRRARPDLIFGPALLALGLSLLWLWSSVAYADYTPGLIDYPAMPSSGALVQNQGATDLNDYDAAVAWDLWLDTNKISMGDSGCGASRACVIFANEEHTLAWTLCTVPDLYNGDQYVPPDYGRTFLIWNGANNFGDGDCPNFASTYPIFVVTLNDGFTYGSNMKLHIARHEFGHALRLDEAPASLSCWLSTYWYPLMKNGSANCSAYGSNYSASANEISTADGAQINW